MLTFTSEDVTDCPMCGRQIPTDIDGATVAYCPCCGVELEVMEAVGNGLEDEVDG